jgi:hypothetical protein
MARQWVEGPQPTPHTNDHSFGDAGNGVLRAGARCPAIVTWPSYNDI